MNIQVKSPNKNNTNRTDPMSMCVVGSGSFVDHKNSQKEIPNNQLGIQSGNIAPSINAPIKKINPNEKPMIAKRKRTSCRIDILKIIL